MIISVLNTTWLLLFAFDALVIVALSLVLRNKTSDQKANVMFAIGIFNCIYWILYKVLLSQDPTFEFILPTELPFHLCNLNTFIIPFAIKSKKPGLLNFCFCFGVLGSVLAMLSPDPGFVNVPFFSSVRGYGYWGTHHILIIQSVLLVSSGFYRPGYKEIPKSIGILLVLYFGMYVINLVLRKLTGLPINYLFTFGMEGNTFIEAFYRLIPVYPLYLLPGLIPLYPACMGLVALGRIGKGSPDAVHS